jgi:hypothetical protein
MSWITLGLFGAGIVLTLTRNIPTAAYLIVLFAGQLGFSTYMTYTRLEWFHPRYLTSCYVAFAVLLALGYEFLVAQRWPGKRPLFAVLVFFIAVFPNVIEEFQSARVAPPLKNPWREVIDETKCSESRTLVLCSPHYLSYIAAYAFRESDEVHVPIHQSRQLLREAIGNRHCILYLVLNREKKPKTPETLELLKNNTDYRLQIINLHRAFPRFRTTPHFPHSLYVFHLKAQVSP